MLLAGWNSTFLAETDPSSDEQTCGMPSSLMLCQYVCLERYLFFFFPFFPCLWSPNSYCWAGFVCRRSCHSLARTRVLNQGWGIRPYGKERPTSEMISWSLNIVAQRLSAEKMRSITFIWWLSQLPVTHVILHAPSPKTIHPFPSCWQKDGCERSALATKCRVNTNIADSAWVDALDLCLTYHVGK